MAVLCVTLALENKTVPISYSVPAQFRSTCSLTEGTRLHRHRPPTPHIQYSTTVKSASKLNKVRRTLSTTLLCCALASPVILKTEYAMVPHRVFGTDLGNLLSNHWGSLRTHASRGLIKKKFNKKNPELLCLDSIYRISFLSSQYKISTTS